MATQPDPYADLDIADDDTQADVLGKIAAADLDADAGGEGDEDGEEVVTFGDADTPPEPETPVIREMRKRLAEANRRLAEVQRAAPKMEPIKIVVGDEPDVEEFEYDGQVYNYDSEKFRLAHAAWRDRRDAVAAQENEAKQVEQARVADHDKVRNAYFQQKSALSYPDVQEAEDLAFGELDGVQQMVIAKYAAKPALLIYALGKNPTKLAQIATEADPIKLGILISKMEATLTTTRRRAPDPEQIVTGGRTASLSGGDKHLEKLEKEADRSGNRTALLAYKRSKKDA